MNPNAIDQRHVLMSLLENDEGVCEYLNTALIENGPQGFLLALKNVIDARDLSVTQLADTAQLNRQNLYKMMSGKQSPKWDNVYNLLQALGLSIQLLPTPPNPADSKAS